MLRITIELWPGGSEQRKSLLYTADIFNDCTGTDAKGNYVGRFYPKYDPGKGRRSPRSLVSVKGFPRKRKSAWHLLAQVLSEAGFG